MRVSPYTATEPELYYGPNIYDLGDGITIAPGETSGSAETQPVTGFLDTIQFSNAGTNPYDISITRENGGAVVYAKTGITGGLEVRPRALLQKAADGSDLTVYDKIWLIDEKLTVAIANADAGDVITCGIFTTAT